jgi:hypothetical protein
VACPACSSRRPAALSPSVLPHSGKRRFGPLATAAAGFSSTLPAAASLAPAAPGDAAPPLLPPSPPPACSQLHSEQSQRHSASSQLIEVEQKLLSAKLEEEKLRLELELSRASQVGSLAGALLQAPPVASCYSCRRRRRRLCCCCCCCCCCRVRQGGRHNRACQAQNCPVLLR